METELVTIPSHPGTALALFTSDGGKDLDPLLAEVREKIDAWVAPDVKTKKGRDEIASFAFKVVRSKTALEKVGKELAAQAKLIPGKIDASRRRINTTLDAWAAEVRAPLTEWEVAEKARTDRHQDQLRLLTEMTIAPNAGLPGGFSSVDFLSQIAAVEAIGISPAACEEFESDYARAKDGALRSLRAALFVRQQQEAEQAEHARLRAAEAEREAIRKKEAEAAAAVERERQRKEREATIAAEAAERARLKAESDAQKERERRENDARAAERAAQQERDVAARREQALRDEAAAAERRAAEADARAKREIAEAAAASERRVAEQAVRAKAEAERREANKRHAAAVNRKARDALVAGGMVEEAATLAVTLIASRKIPAISITY